MRTLETERLLLRRLTVADAPFMFRLLNESSFLHFIGDRGVRSVEDAERYIIDGPIATYESCGMGHLLVVRKSDSAPIGICGLLKRESLDSPDIGYAFVPESWSQGFAIESAKAVLDYAREEIGLERLVAATNSDNVTSIRLLEKLGFTFERMVRLAPNEPEIRLFGVKLSRNGSRAAQA